MPFEVHKIKQKFNGVDDYLQDDILRQAIEDKYNEVALKGGRIVASHVIAVRSDIHDSKPMDYLYLVAETEDEISGE